LKNTAAMILAFGSAVAHAQSSVTIYGIADAAIVGERGGSAGNVTKVTSGAASASRLGFRGTEALGDGLSAFFTLETGAKIDTGEVDAASTIFNRQALVGLKGKFGQVALGRQYTPYHTTLVILDLFGTGYAGTSKNLFPDSGAMAPAIPSTTTPNPGPATPATTSVSGIRFKSSKAEHTVSQCST
jgi:predicted porin